MIHGKLDKMIPLFAITKNANMLGKLEIWEDGGYMLPLEDGSRFVNSVTEFIKA